jgi:predicted nuclease of predicted toxin-antitoxin system
MRFLADESIEKPVVDELRRSGHDVLSIQERSPGVDDDTVLQLAVNDNRILITSDKDFGELISSGSSGSARESSCSAWQGIPTRSRR